MTKTKEKVKEKVKIQNLMTTTEPMAEPMMAEPMMAEMTAETTTDPRVTLAGWSVSGRATPVPARLPHGIVVGTSTGTDMFAKVRDLIVDFLAEEHPA